MSVAVSALDTDDLVETCRRHQGHGRAAMANMLGVVEVSSEGAWVTAADGQRYLDFGGYAVFILGHRHPRVMAAVREQLDRHPMATRVFLEPTSVRAAQALAGVTPAGLDQVHFVNSGAEATEAALKLARAHGRSRLISARHGFHGKTLGALTVTGNPLYQRAFQPLLPEVTHVPYGDLAAMQAALVSTEGKGCVILEPIQGEGGVVLPPPGYLSEVAALCRKHGALLILDEVQTGLGRTGRWWACEDESVVPDILLVGKGLSGGVVPVAAVVSTPEVYAPFGRDPYLHSSTFAGSPLATAAALETIRTILEEEIVARAADLGTRLLAGVTRVATALPGMSVRGRGLLIGLELDDQALVGTLVLELLERGVLVNHSLNASRVLRLTPPAILSDAELNWFLDMFGEAVVATARG